MRLNWRLSGLVLIAAALIGVAGLLLTPSNTAAQDAERPTWHSLPLTDATTGLPFTMADFAGKTVYVEPMATWCTNCRQQLSTIRDGVRGQVDPEQVVFIGLSVETALAPADLASYSATHGFDWTFAVVTPELLGELVTQFGRSVTNPPAVPHFTIAPDGTTSALSTGFHSAESLLAELALVGAAAQP